MPSSQQRKPNRLAIERSPYLLQHSGNPVDWYPWSDEALRRAKNDGKPIMLSIGYSSCHWCHRMREESFEDEKTAQVINRNFIPIKVDREERPEIDAYYMNAVQAMTGGGGWPLTVFLTPDLEPFYGGTYFPPEPKYGMPSFTQVLEFVSRIWKERRGEALSTAKQVTASLKDIEMPQGEGDLTTDILDGTYSALAASFDESHGGFGMAPKFPLPLSVTFMLRYYFRTGKQMALTIATRTLDAIASGGIRDHVGGGFHRYSTDRVWLVPHFEKMMYDNALLARAYTDAYLVTKNEGYASAVRETLGWMKREMRGEEGGFYSAQDADTGDGEGTYYTWTPEEVESVLPRKGAEEFCSTYGVTKAGNFGEGRSILHLPGKSPVAGAAELWMNLLYAERLKRSRPATDTKILTSWNGLAVSAFARAGLALDQPEYLKIATKAANFITAKCTKEGRLLRRYFGGEAGLDGTLEDYAFFTAGLLDLFEADANPRILEDAIRLSDVMVGDLFDSERGGFFMTREAQPARLKEVHDGPLPSGNSVAAMNLMRLWELSGDEKWRSLAEKTLKCFQSQLEGRPAEHALMIAAADSLLNGMREVVITSQHRNEAQAMLREVTSEYLPDTVLVVADSENYERLSKLTALLEGRKIQPKPVAYVCRNFACKLPAEGPEELKAQLATGGH